MWTEIQAAKNTLDQYLAAKRNGLEVIPGRCEVVAHATLSAWVQHWPDQAEPGLTELLARAVEVRHLESSRWRVQRRIALAKLANAFVDSSPASQPTEESQHILE